MVASLAHSEALGLIEQAEIYGVQPGGQKPSLKKVEQAISKLASEKEALQAEGEEEKQMAPADTALLSRALCLCADLHLQVGRTQQGQGLYARAKLLEPDSLRAIAGYAQAQATLGLVQQARDALVEQEKPGKTFNVTDSIYLGKAWMAAGDDDKALAFLKSAWSRGGDSYELGMAHLKTYLKKRSSSACNDAVDGYKNMISSFKDSARLNRKDPQARYKMALLQEEPYRHKLLYQSTTLPEPMLNAQEQLSNVMLSGLGGPFGKA
eukprot:CAMPEP_0197847136 /NCGR_PEP_ID=MMETSP1438-20131217/5261_1 /TAXON_ID=1461541 /ORGANISM="Pterosperma sp., Strain CCMP1384" /LENGTH=265 /DNA_ID=CAMNT_0043458971 /DNA_START=160 /DNA_END=954 /DNA_ORIENTATION=+